MHVGDRYCLPLPFRFFSILVTVFLLLTASLQIAASRYAYMRVGMTAGTGMLRSLGSRVSSYFDMPVAELPEQHAVSGQETALFGIR